MDLNAAIQFWAKRAVFTAILVLMACLLALVVFPLLQPLVWAAVLTVFFYPVHRWILAKLRRPNLAAAVSVLLVLLLLIAPLTWLVTAFVNESLSLVALVRNEETIPKVWNHATSWFQSLPIPQEEIEQRMEAAGKELVGRLASVSARLAASIGSLLFNFFVSVFAMYFMFRDACIVKEFLFDLSPFEGSLSRKMFETVTEMIQVTIRSTLVVAMVQGALTGVLLAVAGLPSPVFWGVVATVLAVVPVFGTALVYVPAGLIVLAEGHTVKGLLIIAAGLVLISSVDNILRPVLISGSSRMNSLLVVVGVLGGVASFGLLGFILGPLVMAVSVGMLKALRETLRAPPPPADASSTSANGVAGS